MDYTGVCPNFTQSQDLLTTRVDKLRQFCLDVLPDDVTAVLSDFRIHSIGSENYFYSDWPIKYVDESTGVIDLSYDDAELLTAGIWDFPLGDLNWFLAEKATWQTLRENELGLIEDILNYGFRNGRVGDNVGSRPTRFSVKQNYPNPFNPNTMISFTLPKAGNIVVKINNLLGQEVATLLNEYRTAVTHTVNFDGSNLASGIYVYSVQFGGNTIFKKMVLLK